MHHSKAQIIATLGPTSTIEEVLRLMLQYQMDLARLNFSWGTLEEKKREIKLIRKVAEEEGRKIPIIVDLPGPRIQTGKGHTYDEKSISAITEEDKEFIKFAVLEGVEYLAVSFVGNKEDLKLAREIVLLEKGKQKLIAKIERRIALQNLEKILEEADAVMVARGDLGNEIPLEQIPFAQDKIIKAAKAKNKPVIVATEMLLSMVEKPIPTRAEITDVANAILEGADAVMLSEETSIGKYPVETVAMMEKIVLEAEKHLAGKIHFNPL